MSREAAHFRWSKWLAQPCVSDSGVAAGPVIAHLCVREPNLNIMIENSSRKKLGFALYAVSIACVVIGALQNFSGSLKVGGLLISLGVAGVLSNAIRLGHLKKW